jgi:hypothetical protein
MKDGGTYHDLPAVSDDGVTALLTSGGVAGRPFGMPPVGVEFIDRGGHALGTATWDHRIWGSCVFICRDTYGFSRDRKSFLIIFNQSEDASVRADNTTLYSVAIDGATRWSYRLGNIRPNELSFSPTGDRIIVTDLREARMGRENAVFVFNADGGLIAKHVIPLANGADGSVLDPTSSLLYAYSWELGLVTVAIESGAIRGGADAEPLRVLSTSPDPRTAAQAARLLSRVRQVGADADSLHPASETGPDRGR